MSLVYNFLIFSLVSVVFFASCKESSSNNKTPTPTPTLWDKIKSNAIPSLLLTSEFNAPSKLANVSTLAWEDGVYVSDDGLHLFAFYAPMDLLKFVPYSDGYGVCPPIGDYIRGPILIGMDLDTEAPIDNVGGCNDGVMHSDIAYSTRSSTSESFSSWTRHSTSNPTAVNPAFFQYEGGLSTTKRMNGNYDIVFSRSTFTGDKDDLYWIQDSTSLTPISPTINAITDLNTSDQEGNPHIERLDSGDDDKLVLLYDNHGDSAATDYIMYYSTSSDGGANWSVAQALGANINNSSGGVDENIQAHLFKDASNDWWLYFTSNRDGTTEIWRSQHNDSANIFTNFNDWAAPEKVIAVGTISGGYGTIAGLGEPTLTSDGDLYFAVVYCKNPADQTSTDSCDVDPWVATKK